MSPLTVVSMEDQTSTAATPKRPQHLLLTDRIVASPNPDLVDQLQFMMEQESTHYAVSGDYLLRPGATATPSDRRTMCAWSYDIVDACSIDREVAVIGASFFDRFMETAASRARAALVSRREFQLAFIACLVVALKCRGGMQVDADFVSDTVCQGLYGADEIVAMEADVLRALGWRLNGPSPHEFVGGLLELLPASCANAEKVKKGLGDAARKSIEDAVVDLDTSSRPPSAIAYAALLTAASGAAGSCLGALDRLAWTRTVALYTGMRADGGATTPPRAGTPFNAFLNGSYCDDSNSLSSYDGYGMAYCSPVSLDSSTRTEEGSEGFALDVLSMAMGAGMGMHVDMGSDLSPVCAVLADRFKTQ